jgi:hypothetical protein
MWKLGSGAANVDAVIRATPINDPMILIFFIFSPTSAHHPNTELFKHALPTV